MKQEVLGIGVDVVELSRFDEALQRWGQKLLERLFCSGEVPEFDMYQRNRKRALEVWCGRFAIKEAVLKALGAGLGQLSWKYIMTEKSPCGTPGVVLCGACLEYARRRGITQVLVSVSHSEHICVAHAVALGQPVVR
ncbi:MAG TPA: holo-ACP synthase [Firmicutes bacterium]|nr:holo-ACP synthase [Bacillota bacterium]